MLKPEKLIRRKEEVVFVRKKSNLTEFNEYMTVPRCLNFCVDSHHLFFGADVIFYSSSSQGRSDGDPVCHQGILLSEDLAVDDIIL